MTSINFKSVPASKSGITTKGISYGGAWGDFNGDNYPDLSVNNHFDPSILYINQRNGTFQNRTAEIFVEEQGTKDQHGSAWADFDNDGDQDLVQLVGALNGLGVGPQFANELYLNEGGKLDDLAKERGIDYPSARGRSPLWLDYNKDGLLDLIVGTVPREDNIEAPPKIFEQNDDGTFQDVSATTGFNLSTAPLSFLADLSGDGNMDLLVRSDFFTVYDITSTPFTDITSQVLPSSMISSDNIAVADFNNDLLPDIYLTTSGDWRTDVYQAGPNNAVTRLRAEKNERGVSINTTGNVTFDITTTDAIYSVPLDEVYIGAEGINPTGWEFTLSPTAPEVVGMKSHTPGVDRGIYIGYDPNLKRWDFLLSSTNQSNPEQRILPRNTLVALFETNKTISAVTPIGFQAPPFDPKDQLLLNTKQGLVDRTTEGGINTIPIRGVSVATGDFDNDMDVDIYVVTTRSVVNTPNILYENQGDGTFVVVPNSGGAAGTEIGQGEIVMTADYNLDGFLDLFTGNGTGIETPLTEFAPYELFENQGNSNHWLQIDLQGLISNRNGIGAQVFATAGGVTQLREQAGGVNNAIQNHQRVHFGLGNNTNVTKLVVNFPSGRVLEAFNIPADQLINVIEPGGNNNDKITGGKGNDLIGGRAGNDVLKGKNGNDYLYGNFGNDKLVGGSGNDNLEGDDGTDLLNGGQGNDFLRGGSGKDTFILQRRNNGVDTVADFQNGQDVFDLKGNLTFAQLGITQVGNNTQISVASDKTLLGILVNTNASLIGAEDFI
ncbi:MAG: VCBS repeat-containing protein [Gomphosphaeria aponina SAG 52.96 = DSM 107014]|uniref:VCBS repeat-containing protein n=1 Tax=Gomphosphaeria aponina SAG 52.96 = DSM 107014 TaxID=1521640 RepID=A0A941GQT1_9CHRO|nr:VCBS repeat-containing protein [Gomphosphaeria aponina SAG 52.96 = DSM 107014]